MFKLGSWSYPGFRLGDTLALNALAGLTTLPGMKGIVGEIPTASLRSPATSDASL
jgi:hypothetical protein